MAKKVRNRPEATEEQKFEFPVFDEKSFIRHELELTTGAILAIGWAVLAAGISAIVSLINSSSNLYLAGAILLGLLLLVASAFVFPRVDRGFAKYTRGEWASVFLLEIFGWLGFWLLMAGAFGHLTAT